LWKGRDIICSCWKCKYGQTFCPNIWLSLKQVIRVLQICSSCVNFFFCFLFCLVFLFFFFTFLSFSCFSHFFLLSLIYFVYLFLSLWVVFFYCSIVLLNNYKICNLSLTYLFMHPIYIYSYFSYWHFLYFFYIFTIIFTYIHVCTYNTFTPHCLNEL
jgi:hypothetical protein